MPCHESHTRGPGVDDLQADQNDPARLLEEAGAARRADGKRRMASGKDPVEALGRIYDLTIPDPDWPVSDKAIVNQVRKIAHTALVHAAAPAKPKESTCTTACDQPSEQHTTSDCPCWQEGYDAGTEAERRPIGA